DAESTSPRNAPFTPPVGSRSFPTRRSSAPPNDYSDDTVQNGTLGFGGSITGDLKVVAIKAASASYLGIENDTGALSAELVGLDSSEEQTFEHDTLTLNDIGRMLQDKNYRIS